MQHGLQPGSAVTTRPIARRRPRLPFRAKPNSPSAASRAAITGNILCAIVGAEGLDQTWLVKLEMRDLIERAACDLFALSVEGGRLGIEDYPPN